MQVLSNEEVESKRYELFAKYNDLDQKNNEKLIYCKEKENGYAGEEHCLWSTAGARGLSFLIALLPGS